MFLRKVLGQPGSLREWATIRTGVAGALAETECLRTLGRLRLRDGLSDTELARRRASVFRLLESIEFVEVTAPVLARAAQPLPTELGALDAIHLTTALLWREQAGRTPSWPRTTARWPPPPCGLKVVGAS